MSRPVLKLWRFIFLTPILGAFGAAVLWALGLASFLIIILVMSPGKTLTPTDGIVVLTGGSERVKTGFDLMKRGSAKEMLISGVHKSVTLADLLDQTHQARGDVPCCITLGYSALDTAGNATETKEWTQSHNIHSVRLVTATYHMPRALVELKRQMPGIRIVPHPVRPVGFDLLSESGMRRGVTEYHKTLVALARLMKEQVPHLIGYFK